MTWCTCAACIGTFTSMLCAAMQVFGMGVEFVAAVSAAAGAAPRHGPGLLAAFTLTPLAAVRRTILGF